MDRVEQMVGDIPPISRAWLASIVIVSVASSNGIVDIVKLVFIPNKISAEPWRLVTLFCYFGPLLFTLVQNLLSISRSVSTLEGGYVFDQEYLPRHLTRDLDDELKIRLKAVVELKKMNDFAYFATQVAASIVVASAAIYTIFKYSGTSLLFLGPILERSLFYIWCKTSPEGVLLILGIPVRAKYALWITQLLYGILSRDFVDVNKAFRIGFLHGLRSLATCEFIAELAVVFIVGHFWWFVRYFLAGELYHELKSELRKVWTMAYERAFQLKNVPGFALRRAVLSILTPPWYYLICRQLKVEQTIREATRDAQVRNAEHAEQIESSREVDNAFAGVFAATESDRGENIRSRETDFTGVNGEERGSNGSEDQEGIAANSENLESSGTSEPIETDIIGNITSDSVATGSEARGN